MSNRSTADDIKTYIADEILNGEDIGALDGATPLLELGVLNSIELMNLVAFIHATYGVRVPVDGMVPNNFQNIHAIAVFVDMLRLGALSC